jgi:hypothetical protein
MATGTNGIATESEAKSKLGYSGSVDTNKCCTKARAVVMGADGSKLGGYKDNQLVKYSDISLPNYSIAYSAYITINGTWLENKITELGIGLANGVGRISNYITLNPPQSCNKYSNFKSDNSSYFTFDNLYLDCKGTFSGSKQVKFTIKYNNKKQSGNLTVQANSTITNRTYIDTINFGHHGSLYMTLDFGN